MPRTILLTGERGIGKSTVCHETVALAQAQGYRCGGLLTLSCGDGHRDLLDLRSGDAQRLTVESDADPAVTQGRFRFVPETLRWGEAALASAVPCNLLVVDEIGPLEVERGEGWASAFDVLKGGGFRLALVVVRPELVAQVQLRLPSSAAVVLAVTRENRDRLPPLLLEMLENELRRGRII